MSNDLYYVIRYHPVVSGERGYTFITGRKSQHLDNFGSFDEDLEPSPWGLKFSTIDEIYELLPEDAAVIEHSELE